MASPWGEACGNLVVWPLHYASRKKNKAVIGGWDPSARKFFKTGELSFTVPYGMLPAMIERRDDSFLKTETWQTVQKKTVGSKKRWGENAVKFFVRRISNKFSYLWMGTV